MAGNDILVKVGADITGFSKSMANATKSLKGFTKENQETFDAFKKTGAVVTGAGLAIAGGLGVAVKQAADFDTVMRKAGAIAGATAGEFDLMKDAAIKLGADTSKSAGEVAEAMTEMAAKGFDATQIIAAMPGVIAASEASGEALALTADTVSSALNVWGLEAGEASRVADVLAMSANVSAAGIDDLGYVLKYAGAPAAALGISLEELAAAAGLMTDAGLDGSNAGTSLRASLLALNNPAKAQAKIMKGLGFSMRDSKGNAKGLSEMIRDMTKATEGMTEAEKVATIGKLVGTEAVSGFLALMKAGPDAIDKNSAALENSAGASQEAADKMMAGIGGAMEELSGAFESAAILIGDQLIPFVQKLAEVISGLVNKFNEASPAFQKFAVIGTAVAAGLMLIIGPILLLIGFIPSIIAGFIAVKTVFLAVGAAISTAIAPVLIVIGVVAALIAIFVHLWKTNEGFRDAILAIWERIKEGFTVALEFIMGIVKTVITEVWSFIKEILGKIKIVWDNHGKAIMAVISGTFKIIWEIIKLVMGYIKGLFQVVWPLISGIVKIAWGVIKTVIRQTMDVILGIIDAVMYLIKGDWEGAWNSIKSTAVKIMNNIIKFFKEIDLKQIGKDIINGLIKGLVSMVGAAGRAIKNVASSIKNTITSFFGIHSPSRVMRDQVGVHIGGGLAAGITKSTSKVKSAMTAQATALKKSATEAIKNLEVKFDTNKMGASKYISELKKIQNQYKLTGDQSRKVQKEIFQAGKLQAKQAEGFKKSIAKINDGVKTADTKFLDKVKSINSKLKTDIKKLNDSFKKELAGLASSIYNQVGLFDEVKSEKVDGGALLKNVRAQNQQFNTLQRDLGKIQSAGVSKAFLDELKAMGVGAADEISAIANMPKSMLNDYVKAWKEKHALANAAANAQMVKAKENTAKQIQDLTKAASSALSKAKTDWVTQLKKFAETAKSLGDFKNSGKVLGKDVIAGLVNGLRSMKGPLADAAKTLAKSVASTIKSTLKIKSPSRVMMELGRFTGEGLAVGIANMRGMVERSAEELAQSAVVKPDLSYATPNANYSSLSKALSGEVNVNQRDAALVGAIANLERKLTNLVVEMDGQKVGGIVADTVSERINAKASEITRGRGRRRI